MKFLKVAFSDKAVLNIQIVSIPFGLNIGTVIIVMHFEVIQDDSIILTFSNRTYFERILSGRLS
jgi:hypothetical protein